MAQTPYSVKLNQAYQSVQTLEDTLRSIQDTSSKPYKDILKQLQDANKEYADLQKQESDWKKSQAKSKDLNNAKELQRELDIANASGDTAKIKDLAGQITKLGGTPYDANGNAIDPKTGTAAKPKVSGTPTVTGGAGATTTSTPQPISKLPVFAKVSGTNIVDMNGKVIGTTDGKTFTMNTGVTSATSGKPTITGAGAGAGTGTGGTGVTGGLTLADPKTAWINYLQTAFNADPSTGGPDAKSKAQIDAIFKDAQAGVYTEATFLQALDQVPWWNQMGPSMQSFFLETHDKSKVGFYNEQLTNAKSKIQATLANLGVDLNNVDPVTGKIIDTTKTLNGIAMEAIKNNWLADQNGMNQLEHYLATNASLMFTKGGVIQSNLDTIKQEAHLYGINLDDTMQKTIQSDLVDPTSARDANYWKSQMKNLAMDQYKPFAASIKDGSTLYQATYNYRTQMANLLETSPDNITWSDLMGGVIDSTTGNARTQADFTKQVKNNPLWQYTQNAKDTYTSLGENLMKEFGFVG